METATFNVIYNRKKKLLSNGTALVQIEVYLNSKKKYFSTNIYLTPDQWDNKHRKVKKHPNALKLNRQISDFVTKLQGVELDRRNAGKPFSLDLLTEFMKGRFTNSFTDFMQTEIDADRSSAKGTIKNHRITLKLIKRYKNELLFSEMTFELLQDLEQFWLKEGYSINTINKHFRHIRKFINLAINKDLFDLSLYPFRKFRPKKETTQREFLTPEEIILLENISIPKSKEHLIKTLDMFLFSCYTGLRFSDLSALSKKDIRTINGEKWLYVTMQKTNLSIQIPLFLLFDNKPIEILDRYIEDDKDYIFDSLTNQYVNRKLKEIAEMAGITKNVTFHTARHTQATYLLYKGVSVTTVQKLLGHKKLETTQIYSKVMDRTITNELRAIKFD